MTGFLGKRTLAGVALVALISGCADGGFENPLSKLSNPLAKKDSSASASPAGQSSRRVERDVEAPDVFQVSEKGLWDGRPSLGGVWVAYPDVTEPERVIIRNEATGAFVIGALFRRERATPGPRIEVSSDAADALGMLAGAPVDMTVTALRREEIAEPTLAATTEATDAASPIDAPAEIEAAPLDPIASAAAAIDAPAPEAPPAPVAPPAQASSLEKPYIQLGIFSVQANADRTAERMRAAGIVPSVIKSSSRGKTFWRVIVGPASSASERKALLAKVKADGFDDAYFVTD